MKVKAILNSGYFANARHASNYIAYIDRQSPIFDQNGTEKKVLSAQADVEAPGNSTIWYHVYSLNASDCERLEVNRNYMKNLIALKADEMAKAYNISPSNLRMVCSWHNKGVVFCTGTPISNSAAELYTMMRYIQADTLREHGLYAFDAWAANFGETVSAMELAPEGTGYRMKTRFARFNNLPELISMWKLAADVQTADMLKLEVPELEGGKPTVIMCPPTELQKHTIQALGERAEAVRAGSVDPHMDNMLKIVRC